MNLNWENLRAFRLVAETGKLTLAASQMGLSNATVARRIDALEASLGYKVLRRRPQGSQLTPEGEHLLDVIQQGARHFDDLERLVRQTPSADQPKVVRISSTEPMIADVLAPNIALLYDTTPGLKIELETSLELSNLNRGDADLAIRLVRPRSDNLVARKLPAIQMGLFAAKAYVGRRRKLELKQEKLLWYDQRYGPIAENKWLQSEELELQIVMTAGSIRALTHAALSGLGIAPLPCFLARRYDLLQVDAVPLPPRQPWLVFHRDARNDKQLKAVREWIVSACQAVIR